MSKGVVQHINRSRLVAKFYPIFARWKSTILEDSVKNKNDPKNKDNLKNEEDDPKNMYRIRIYYNPKEEDDLKKEDE